MAAATLTFGADSSALRHAFAFSVSLLLHLTFALVIILSIRREVAPLPLEISIFEGAKGPASPPPGERSAEPGPAGPPVEATNAPAARQTKPPHLKMAAPSHATPESGAVEHPVEEQALLAALKRSDPPPITQGSDSMRLSVAQRKAPSEGAAQTGVSGRAQSEANDTVGSVVGEARQPSDSLAGGPGSLQLPGPGGSGTGWISASNETGAGGGGTGRGGFSVSGAGAGGAGRSYTSIWESTQRYLAGLRSAYNDELLNEATLRGVIVVRYEILGSGAVGKVTIVSSQLGDSRFEQEVLHQIRGWRYPPDPSGTVVVTWPFSFRPPS